MSTDAEDRPDGSFLERADAGARTLRRRGAALVPDPILAAWRALTSAAASVMPKGLFARALLIIILPMVILQSVLAQVFLDRHYELVTRRLSDATVREVAALIDLLEGADERTRARLVAVAADRLNLGVTLGPPAPLPAAGASSFLGVLDSALSDEIEDQIGLPFSVRTEGETHDLVIAIALDEGLFEVTVPRRQAYASNWHFFLVWMVTTALVLILVAVLFLRNQIRPIQRLARAADSFGKGRPVADFRPSGAREVRQAAHAFIAMRRRIERQIEQRTAMLAGVSHDLRTLLTRFRLELAFLGDDAEALRRDVDDMEAMLEAYLAFAKGDGEEAAEPTDVEALIAASADRHARAGVALSAGFAGDPLVTVRPVSFRRLVDNLIGNAVRHGRRVDVTGRHDGQELTLTVDDDGPGIPEESREAAFRPFTRLDTARNQDEGGTGLGLAIARDIALGHGGEISLEAGPLGGLRVLVRLPG